MRMFVEFVRADLRRAMPYLPWLLGAHVARIALRTRWAGEFSSALTGALEWTVCALSVWVAVAGLWWDAPLRRQRYLATRPQRWLPLTAAKWVALALVVLLPFGVVDFAVLMFFGFGGSLPLQAAARTLLMGSVVLTALHAAVWWWRSVNAGLLAGLMGAATLVAASHVLARSWSNRNFFGGKPLDLPVDPLMLLVFFASMALLLAGGWWPLRRLGAVVKIGVFGIAAGATWWFGLWLSLRPVEPDQTVKPAVVRVDVSPRGGSEGRFDWLTVAVPSGSLQQGVESLWTFSRLELDRRDIRPWRSNYGNARPQLETLQEAMRAHFGPEIPELRYGGPHYFHATAILPGGEIRGRAHRIGFDLLETRVRWVVVADLPLKAGAEARTGNRLWRVEDFRTGRGALRGHPGWSGASIRLTEAGIARWGGCRLLGGDCHGVTGEMMLLFDPATGGVRTVGPVRRSRGLSHAEIARTDWFFPEGSELAQWGTVQLDNDLRLVVLRPKVVNRVEHVWDSPGVVRFPSEYQLRDAP
jgi:hypothetical protein